MSLLDKASLVQIPSGYGDGKLYSVKPTPTYGSELITNGDFSSDSDWSLGSGWSIGSGSLNAIGAGNYAVQTNVLAQNTNAILKVQWTQTITSGTRLRFFARNYNDGGSETVLSGSATDGGVYSNSNCVGSGTYTIYVSVTNGYSFKLLAESGNNATVDNVSVKEILVADGDFDFSRSSSGTRVNAEGLIEVASVLGSEEVTNGDFATDSDWTKGSGWTISGGKATKSGTDLAYLTQSSLISVIGKTYRVKASITNVTTGNIRIDNFTSGTTYTSNIEIDITYTATSVGVFRFLGWGGFDGSIDNVSVKEVIENDVPRLDYSGGACCASLLLEPQRTNLVTHSSDFSGGWALDDATKVSNSTTSPDGTVNAITLIGNTNASRHHISKVAAGSVTASLSVFAKAKELRYLQIASANITSQYVNFDVSDGTIGTVGSSFTDAKIEDYGNGWYRCSVTSTNQYNSMYISLVSSLTSSWLESWTMSNNTDGLYLYGAQVEQGDYATSYIPTSGSTVTRTADVCDNAGTSATFNDAEGVLFAEIAALANDGTNRTISISDGTNTNQIVIRFSSTANQVTAYITDGGVITAELTHTLTNALNYNKIGLKYKLNDVGLWVNGTEVATDTSATMPSGFDELKFSRADGANDFYGKCKQLMVFDEALSDSELQALTS